MVKPLYTGSEWDFNKLELVWKHIERIAKDKYDLTYYPAQIEILTSEQMLEMYSSTGMPFMYCVSGDTEYLSESGWKKISEYREGDTVAQYNRNGEIEFVLPLEYIETPSTRLDEYENTATNQKVTPNHKLIFKCSRKDRKAYGNLKFVQSSNYVHNFELGVITTFRVGGRGLNLSASELRLKVAMKADGSIVNESTQRFGFKKQRKVDRLRSLLHLTDTHYTESVHADGLRSFRTKIRDVDSKRYVWNYSEISQDDAEIIFDEMSYWDGCKCYQEGREHITFTSKYKEDVDFMQYVGALCGFRSTINKTKNNCFTAYFTKQNLPTLGKVREVDYDKAYCFTVPSHMWVSRRKGKIAVTGNSHWSFGKDFIRNKQSYEKGQMGLAYELVVNTNPSIAYLMEDNSMTMQTLVLAHASVGHSAFFKHNYLFKEWTKADSIIPYLKFAKEYISECEEQYGLGRVEQVLDACHSIKRYGVHKYKKPKKVSQEAHMERQQQRDAIEQENYNELFKYIQDTGRIPTNEDKNVAAKNLKGITYPYDNLLYFIEKYSMVLEPWEREIVRIVRKINEYFYPQMQTKVMNEGWATFWHYHLMIDLYDEGLIDEGAYLEFIINHTAVVAQPPYDSEYFSQINPYTLGFNIFMDLKRVCMEPTEEDLKWFPEICNTDWLTTLKDIANNYRDESFILQFLSPKVIRDMELFCIWDHEGHPRYEVSATHDDEDVYAIRKALAQEHEVSYYVPVIEITDCQFQGIFELELTHFAINNVPLDEYEAKKVLANIEFLWGYSVVIKDTAVKKTHGFLPLTLW